MKTNIMGSEWTIEKRSESEDETLKDLNGYTDWTVRLIVVLQPGPEIGSLANKTAFCREILRHEIIHAYLLECGLDGCSFPCGNWAINEEMVDWFARKWEQINKTICQAEKELYGNPKSYS